MKKLMFVLCVVALVAAPSIGSAAVSEKTTDTRNYQVSPVSRSDSVSGNIDGSNTFDRVYSVTYDGTCNASSSDSSQNGVGYEVFAFHTTVAENLDASTTDGGLGDSVMFVYCDPFDPANPDLNLVAWDDDDGAGLMSAITPADGVAIAADTTYYIVITGWSPTDLGAYTLDLGGDFAFGPAEQPTPTPAPTATPAGPSPVPTTSRTGLVVMMALLGVVALVILRRRVV